MELKYEQSLLIADSDSDLVQQIEECMRNSGIELSITCSTTSKDFQYQINSKDFDVIILDDSLIDSNLELLLRAMICKDQEPSIVLMTSVVNPEKFVEFVNAGCRKIFIKNDLLTRKIVGELKKILRTRKAAESYLGMVSKLTEANQILDEKNKRLDEFSATLAHDIRGPLGSLTMRLEYLMDAYRDDFDRKCIDIMSRALKTTERLTDIVQAMYDYAKLGVQATKMFEVNLNSLVNEVISDLSFDDSIDINIEITDFPEIWGNAQLLRRVFLNLISNAVKYNDKRQVIISIKLEDIIERSLGKFCKISFSDNGPGIPEKDQGRIFSFFQRGNAGVPVEHTQEGLGVGLAVVKRIVELHFGRIYFGSGNDKVNEFHNQLGNETAHLQGACFIIELPMEKIFID